IMPVKLRVSKARDMVITARAVELFTQMRRLAALCTCPPSSNSLRECPTCRRWQELHNELHAELHCRPWQWPLLGRRLQACSTAPIVGATQSWPSQAEYWRALDSAAKAQRKLKSLSAEPPAEPDAEQRDEARSDTGTMLDHL